jgi:hypothetical protein
MLMSAQALQDGHTVLSYLNGIGGIITLNLGIAFIGWSMEKP